jgi:hypothetical protein
MRDERKQISLNPVKYGNGRRKKERMERRRLPLNQ